MRYRFPAFAKINWYLKIFGRRPDGFHELITVLQTIDWGDLIELDILEHSLVQLEVVGREVAAGEENLAVRAARLLQQQCGVRRGVRLRLHKRLPVGGGLGGGSSNAAVTMLFLNQLWSCGLKKDDLAQLGAQLGSDVPFFFEGGMVAACGRGEKLSPLPDGKAEPLILLIPELSVATSKAYELGRWAPWEGPPKLTRDALDNTILRFRGKVERGDSVRGLAENEFDGLLLAHFPPLDRARLRLLEAGCEKVIVSGSGSTLLGLASPERLAKVANHLSAVAPGEVRLCRTLPRRRYWKTLKKSGLQPEIL